jgi:hypothetical protein
MGTAVISPCGLYRYTLSRSFAGQLEVEKKPRMALWVMLNSSRADADKNDPTIRRCAWFSERDGFDGFYAGNLYAFRSPNPDDLRDSMEAGIDPIGPDNDEHLRTMASWSDAIICAWGAHPMATEKRVRDVVEILRGYRELQCLGLTASGAPRHPLYVKGDAPLTLFKARSP